MVVKKRVVNERLHGLSSVNHNVKVDITIRSPIDRRRQAAQSKLPSESSGSRKFQARTQGWRQAQYPELLDSARARQLEESEADIHGAPVFLMVTFVDQSNNSIESSFWQKGNGFMRPVWCRQGAFRLLRKLP